MKEVKQNLKKNNPVVKQQNNRDNLYYGIELDILFTSITLKKIQASPEHIYRLKNKLLPPKN